MDDDGVASGSGSNGEEERWAIVRLDGGQSVGDPFLAQIELADGSSGNCLSPANWTYNLRSLHGDKLADGVAVLKPRALGRTTPNAQGYGLAVRVLDGDKATLKLWDAGELHDDGPCEEASSSSGSGSSSVSGTSSGSSASVSSSASGSAVSSSASGGSSSHASSSSPASGSTGNSASSGSVSGSGPGSSGSAGGSGGGSGGGGSGGGGSGGGGSGSAGGSSSGSSDDSSSSGSASSSPSSSGSPPTTIKYNGVCYSIDDSAGYITLPSGAQVISPGEWWADCQDCKATCCASHATAVCTGCFSSNSTADISLEVTETYTDGRTPSTFHYKMTASSAPIQCNNAYWAAASADCLYEEDGQAKPWPYGDANKYLNAGLGGNEPDWVITSAIDTDGHEYGPLFAGQGRCKGIHETKTADIAEYGPNPFWDPGDPESPMFIDQTVGTRTVKYNVSVKNNPCCRDEQGNCHNKGQGQTYCDGGCVEEPPLP